MDNLDKRICIASIIYLVNRLEKSSEDEREAIYKKIVDISSKLVEKEDELHK